MSLRLAHGPSEEEINKYSTIDGNELISIAEYSSLKDDIDLASYKHNHDDYEFIIPLKTIPLIFYEKAEYIGEVGFCYPINPYSMHGVESAPKGSSFLSVVIKRDYLDKIKAKFDFANKFFYARFNVGFSLIEYIRTLQKFLRSPVATNDEILNYIYLISAYFINFGLVTSRDDKRPEKKYFPKMKTIALYMYDNYKNPDLTIKDLADMSGYSIAYFTKSFRQFMNDTPINHLNRLRLSEAKSLFYDKSLSIKDIAKMVGYKNETTFTEAFKRINGELPKEFRRKYY
ncbi:MAG: helix-turn-helix transcriptional regulator [Bacilli bacterium]|nr:helix-turn-helix transcriptional regulator [Bacilli bacterium]